MSEVPCMKPDPADSKVTCGFQAGHKGACSWSRSPTDLFPTPQQDVEQRIDALYEYLQKLAERCADIAEDVLDLRSSLKATADDIDVLKIHLMGERK